MVPLALLDSINTRNVQIETIDFTKNELSYWRRQKKLQEEMENIFIEEGNYNLISGNETISRLRSAETGGYARYLYIVKKES